MATKTKTYLDLGVPVVGAADGKAAADPAVRQRWLDQRAGGFTATDARDWGIPSKRREIVQGKVTMVTEDLNHIPAVAHGNRREPIIAEWVHARFGISPCDNVYSRHDNVRHLASPDGVTRDVFTDKLVVGPGSMLAEIKTSKHSLLPGTLDAQRVLLTIEPGSQFERSGYYVQMQWQMYVMNADLTLFVWERHTGVIDETTGTYTPHEEGPQYAWIRRDDALIARLVEEVAPKALAEIDAARAAVVTDSLPPAGVFSSEHAALIASYFKALEAEKVAAVAKKAAWTALQSAFPVDDLDAADVVIEQEGFARLTVATSQAEKMELDEAAMMKRAPKLVEQYRALEQRYTKPVVKRSRKMTLTQKKASA